jgi:hypothetical protein
MLAGGVAIAVSLWAQSQNKLPFTDPVRIAILIPLLRGSPYVAPDAGIEHLAYVAGLAALTAVLLFLFARTVPARAAMVAGATVAALNGLAAAPQAAAGGGLTGLFLLAAAVMFEMALIGFAVATSFAVLRRAAR